MIFKLRKTKREKMIIYKGSGHMTSGCVTVHDTDWGRLDPSLEIS